MSTATRRPSSGEDVQINDEKSLKIYFRQMGELVNTIINEGTQYEVYKCEESTPRFRDYHERLQAWIMFYIYAASFINTADGSWWMFMMFEAMPSYAFSDQAWQWPIPLSYCLCL